MKFILTNDDGFDAPGLEVLHRIAKNFGSATIVAPAEPQSGMAHRVTTHAPLRADQFGPQCHKIYGTPADCARIGLKQIVPDADWLLAGINPGANLGSDVYNSGTLAAVREAAILGCRAMAVSQYISLGNTIDWQVTGQHAEAAVAFVLRQPLPIGQFWNVNLPHPLTKVSQPAMKICGLDLNPHAYQYRSEPDGWHYQGIIHDRPRDGGKDVAVCFGGDVAITRLTIDAGALDAT